MTQTPSTSDLSWTPLCQALEADMAALDLARMQQQEVGPILAQIRDRLRSMRDHVHRDIPSARARIEFYRTAFFKCACNDKIRMLLAGFLFDDSKVVIFWQETLRLAQGMIANTSLPVSARYSLMLSCEYLGFMNKAAFGAPADMDYEKNVRQVLQDFYGMLRREQPVVFTPFTPQRKRVLILLRLWREPAVYSPALEALDYGLRLTRAHGYDVALLNCNLLHDQMPVPFWPPGQFEPRPVAEQMTISYQGCDFTMFHRRGAALDQKTDQAVLARVREFAPGFALAFGDCNLYADALATLIPTLTLHYTTDAAIHDTTLAAQYGDTAQFEDSSGARHLWLKPSATDVPPRLVYDRAALGLKAEDFVFAIVGNRLRSEVTAVFLQRLEAIAQRCPRARFVFCGFYDQPQEAIALYPHVAAQAVFAGQIEDVRGMMEIADAMLNPDRAGGGHAAAQAMAAGKPVVTCDGGDVSKLAGPDLACGDDGAYVACAIRLIEDNNFYRTMAADSGRRHAQLCDRTANVAVILQAVEAMQRPDNACTDGPPS